MRYTTGNRRNTLIALVIAGIVMTAAALCWGSPLHGRGEPAVAPPKPAGEAKPAPRVIAPVPSGSGSGTQTSAKMNAVKGLTLSDPQKRTRPGLAYVSATLTAAKPDSKVRIVWDVESQWDDEEVSVEWEAREGGKKLQITIPDSSGVIRVTAVAVVDGEPTDTRMARTLIEVAYTPRKPRAKEAGDGKQAAAAPAASATASAAAPAVPGKVVDAYLIVDPDTVDANIQALVSSQGTRNALIKAGVKPHVLDAASAAVARAGLATFVKDAGGGPVMVLVTDTRRVKKIVKLSKTTTAADLVAQIAGR